MRTVSFSSDPVRRLLNSDFVCATINIDGDPTAGASVGHAPTDSCGSSSRGIGRPNVQCLFLTPAGDILHVASGYVGPKDMEKEVKFAKRLYDAVRKSPGQAKTLVARQHALRLREFGFNDADIQSRGNTSTAHEIANRVFRNMRMPIGRTAGGRTVPRLRTFPRTPGAPRGSGPGDGDNFGLSRSNGIFASFGKRAVLGDHQFSIDHPLYPMSDFLENPRVLIGNEQTAYMSVGPGGASGGSIGGNSNTRVQYGKYGQYGK